MKQNKIKHGPLHGGKTSSVQNKKVQGGTVDRDDQHPDEGGEVWFGTKKFGAFRPKKEKA